MRLIRWIIILSLMLTFTGWSHPQESWPRSTPEVQGMDSERILRMLRFIDHQQLNIHSVLIIRHGHLVSETYYPPYTAETVQRIFSCTKSFASALMGMAIDRGYVEGIHQRMGQVFPEYVDIETPMGQISIHHLLSMTDGLDWPEWANPYMTSQSNPVYGQNRSEDRVRFFFERSMAESPGARFNYNSGSSHILMAIVQKALGASASRFADENLFKPMGIHRYHWWADRQGIPDGGGGLSMTPRDLAKFGYLYLKEGSWNGNQLLSPQWVTESTKEHIKAQLPLVTEEVGYGYQWWMNSFGGYSAQGLGGQYLFVVPEKDLVVVFTCGLSTYDMASTAPERLMSSFILPAIRSNKPIPNNPKDSKALREFAPKGSNAMADHTHSPIEREISGQRYVFSDNLLGVHSLVFNFAGKDASVVVNINGTMEYEVFIGKGGQYRVTKVTDLDWQALRGGWQDERTLLLEWQVPFHTPETMELELVFEDDTVSLTIHGTVERYQQTVVGRCKK